MTPVEALAKAVAAVGGPTEMGRRLGVSTQAVSQWKEVPPKRVIDVEEACGRIVTRYELRPDIFGQAAA